MPANQIMCSIANEAITISEANNIHKHYENLLAIKMNGESLNHLEQNQLDDISLAWFIYRIKSDSGDQVRKKYIQKFFIKESFKLIGHFIKLIGALILFFPGVILSLLPVLIPFTIAFSLVCMCLIISLYVLDYMGAHMLFELKIFDFISTHIQNYLQSKKLKELEPLTFTLVINEYNSDFHHIKYRSPFLFSRLHILDPNLQHIDRTKFSGCTILTRIVLPNSLTTIGDSAFYGCTSLTHVTIPNSVKHIGYSAFRGCTSLIHVTIPNSVERIGDSAFYGCTSLTHVTIPNSVKHIGYSAFRGCTSLTHVTIPNSVERIGDSAFYGCTSLTHVTIPNSVERIGDSAFSRCTILTHVTIPNSVKHIGESAFSRCTSLTHVTIPNSVKHIGNFAFYKCTSLTHVTIPNSVKRIGESAFYRCTSLTHVTIPNSVKHIGNFAFNRCTSLTQVNIPSSVTAIDPFAFESCPNLQIIAIDDSNQENYQRIVNQLPPVQQQLARPWSVLKAAQETKQQALKSLAALSMRGIMTHLLLKLSIKKGQEFLSVWQLLPRRLWVLEEWRAFSIRDGVLNQNLDHFILKNRVSPCAPGFATMLKKINIRMAVQLNSAVAEIPLPTSQEERETLFEDVRKTALPYSTRMLIKPLQINQAAENCLDKDNHVASP